MGRRVALLGAAVLIALLGTLLIYIYVRGADDRAMDDQELVSVLVAAKEVPAGTTGRDAANSDSFQLTNLPSNAVSDGALSDVTPILDQVAVTKIVPGQQLLSQLFSTEGPIATAFGDTLEEGHFASAYTFEDPQRVAGFVQPGSRVAVFLTAAAADGGVPTTRLLLPDVKVIAVGATTLEQQANGAPAQAQGALLTLSLDQAETEKMIQADSLGTLYLALHDGEPVPTPGPGVSIGNLF